MARQKITVTLSSKCLALLDQYSKHSGLENRSRTIEEVIFTLSDLLSYVDMFYEDIDEAKSRKEEEDFLGAFMSRVGACLKRFRRFESGTKVAEKVA